MEIKRIFKPYWKEGVIAPSLMLIEVYMHLLQPKLMASIINDGVVKGDLLRVQKTGGLMTLVGLLGLLGGLGCIIFSSRVALCFATDLRTELFKKVQSFSFTDLDQFQGGSLKY